MRFPFDPPLSPRGRCVVCDKARPPLSKTSRDPFCSADCCRKWYAKNGPEPVWATRS